MYYYKDSYGYIAAKELLPDFISVTEQEAAQAEWLRYISKRTKESKTIYRINHPAYFCDQEEGLWCLDENQMDRMVDSMTEIPVWMKTLAANGQIMGISANFQQLSALYEQKTFCRQKSAYQAKKRVHILAMGDVGSTLLMGLTLLGGDCIETIGIYDFNQKLCQRWEHEINQIAYPWEYNHFPHVEVLQEEQLFQCDVFVFCASKAIPPIGDAVQDVRMAQLDANSEIIQQYGMKARREQFQGLFAVVSDPVDPLCQRVWISSNQDASGNWDGGGLRPEQIQGYGLGVMNSRAAYFAKQEQRFSQFLTEGRAYGPHGQKLVIADSIAHYNHQLSLELTKKTVEANLEVRDLGYKPYVAPALSSAAISILLTIRGEWHYSSNFLGGVYMGAKNRNSVYGTELEYLPLPEQLLARLQAAMAELNTLQWPKYKDVN